MHYRPPLSVTVAMLFTLAFLIMSLKSIRDKVNELIILK